MRRKRPMITVRWRLVCVDMRNRPPSIRAPAVMTYSATTTAVVVSMTKSIHVQSCASNGSQNTKKPRSAPKYGSKAPNPDPVPARNAVVQSVWDSASAAPRATECGTPALVKSRPGTVSGISRSPTCVCTTKETTDCRTVKRCPNENNEAASHSETGIRAMVPTRARQTDVAPSASYQAYDEYKSATNRPASNRAASVMAQATSHRRSVISQANALRPQPAFHLAANRRQTVRGESLVSSHDDRLCVRRPDQPPAVAEQDADTVDVDDLVPGLEVRNRPLDESELQLFRNLDPDLGGRDVVGHVGERLLDRLLAGCENAQQPSGAIERVVVPIETLADKHVARHLALDGGVRLFHLILDERMSRLPHDGLAARFLDRLGQRLRALHVEYDGLALPRPLENIARIDDQYPVPPDDRTIFVDDTDAVSVAVERDTDLRLVFCHGGDQVFQILGDRRIWMVIGKGAVALAEQAACLDAQGFEQLRRNERARAVAAVIHHSHRRRERACASEDILDVVIDDPLRLHRSALGALHRLLNQRVQVPDLVTVQRRRAERQLEAVVLGRVV